LKGWQYGDFHFLQTGTVIQMLMTASEQISMGLYPRNHDKIGLEDAQTLIRVMCHKKDRQASKFLKRLYQLPTSSGDFSASLICLHGVLILYDVQIVLQ
jgi:hypothetical protein